MRSRPTPALSVSPSGVTAELAYHWFAAHNLPAAFSASAQAGADAMRLAAFAESNAHYERAIELWDGVSEEVRAAVRASSTSFAAPPRRRTWRASTPAPRHWPAAR